MSSHTPNQTPESEELLQVVDDADQPIRAERRSTVHAEGLLHRAVHVLVFNRGGDLYLQRRSAQKDTWPGYWDTSCSGHVSSGEFYQEAAVRELAEELGIRDAELTKIGKLEASEKTGNEFVLIYSLIHDGPIVPNESEIDESRFFHMTQVRAELASKSRPFTPCFREVFQCYLASSETVYGEGGQP